jgi:Glycosyl transferase family 2
MPDTRDGRAIAHETTNASIQFWLVMRLTAVVPATDKPASVERCVAALRSSSEPPDELVVVEEPVGLGPSSARNLGARRATGEILMFVDADVEVHPDACERIRLAFANDPWLAAVFGSYDDEPLEGGLVSEFRNILHHYVHQRGAGPATTFWTGLGAIRKEVFEAAGGFDERRFTGPSVEDIELGMRVAGAGGRILLDPTIMGKHLKRWTLATMIETDLNRRGVPWVELMLEQRSSSTALNLGWKHRLATLGTIALVWGAARRDSRLFVAALTMVLVLDGGFYRLLFRRRGARVALAAVPLHVVHRLTSAIAIPTALAKHIVRRGRT